jgi:hypothetical protein
MRSFTAKYVQPHTRDEANHFVAWVRRAISSSRNLRTLRLIDDSAEPNASVSFDGLISHLTARHFKTLRVLDIGSAFIGRDALKQLCVMCTLLEDLTAGIRWSTLVINYYFLYFCSVHRHPNSKFVTAGFRYTGLRLCHAQPSHSFLQHQER